MKRYPLSVIPTLFLLLMLNISNQSFAQTFIGVSSTPVDNGTQIGPDATIIPPAGMQNGDLVVVYGHYYSLASTTLSISFAAGQVWNVGGTQFGNNQSYFIAWCRFTGTWSGDPVVSVPAGNTNALTATMYVYRPTTSTGTWAIDQVQVNSNSNANPHTITGVTNAGTNTVTMAFWTNTLTANTWAATASAGWSQAGLANQYRNLGTGLQGHSAAYRIAGAGATGNVAKSQNIATTNTRKAIISWRQISNDLCANAIPLSSGTACVNTAGNMFGSTVTPTTINSIDCATGVTYDVWYRFVAQTTNPTISLSSVAFPNPNIQILSNNCGGTFNSFFCGTTSVTTNHLTPGTTYFIRVYSTGAAPGSLAAGAFNICITDPVTPPPPNDECANAPNLMVAPTCTAVTGDIAGATPSSPALGILCSGPLAYDVWYKFTAVNNTATVSLAGIGTNFLNPGIEVFSGSCGSLTSIACTSGTSVTMAGTLTTGVTYYVRVYSRTAPPPNGNARFNICVTSSLLPIVRFGNSYVNISKQTTGGVVQPGDTLEIRMMLNHTQVATLTNARFVDNVPTNTSMLTGVSDRIRIITNEGLPYKQYTLGAADDPATYLALPPAGEYNVRVNLGFGASLPGTPVDNSAAEFTSATGTMVRTDYPRTGGPALLFAIAYRVIVTGAVGDIITLNPAQFIYRNGGSDVTLTGTSYQILISDPLALCSNSNGINNAVESGGTFGSGTTLNRPNDLTTPIPGYNFINNVTAYNAVGDGRYAIVKNISPRSGTNRNANRVTNNTPLPYDDPLNRNNRMFNGHWYADGDHSGTTDAIGNVPPAATTNSGYMLMVNADYVPSDVYKQTLTNLCPSTYYEFSAWVRNICPTCGVDSIGAQFTGTPTAPTNGYPGVYPNLTFGVDGVDYYNTGQVDTTGWIKRGFVFLTGPSQTSATLAIRNNSQGGGGNDFVIDDIGVATCLPGLTMRPNNTPTYCRNASVDLSVAVSTFYNNYILYQWERSTDGGATWGPAPEMPGVQTFTYTPSAPNYLDTVAVPTFLATAAIDGYMYRIRTATSLANLSVDNCSIYNSTDIITINIHPTCDVLPAQLLKFNAQLNNAKTTLLWTAKEDAITGYEVERSTDGVNFSFVGYVDAKGIAGVDASYSLTDPVAITGKTYYRLKLLNTSGNHTYSNTITVTLLQNQRMDISNLVNPFRERISFQLNAVKNEEVKLQLLDAVGHPVYSSKLKVLKGSNAVAFEVPQHLAKGTYVLRIVSAADVINKIIQKQ
jgi:trimeric autotransporter adhesin